MKDAQDQQVKKIKFSKKVSDETDLEPTSFWCYVPADPKWVSPFGTGRDAGWDIFTPKQRGYEMATKRLPTFTATDLENAIGETKDEALQLKYYKLMKEHVSLRADKEETILTVPKI